MTFTVCLMLAIWGSATLLTLFGTWLTLRHYEGGPENFDFPFGLYPISVLKPLKGMDNQLRENLLSFFSQKYPTFELIFCVAEATDPAAKIARELINEHPQINARLLIGEEALGINPKINNIARGYHQASHDWILISDSNVRVENTYLKKLVSQLQPNTGIITAVISPQFPYSWAGELESAYLSTFYVRGMHLADAVGHPCVIGKSMLFQRSTADRFGGVRTLGRYLAEDYMAGEAIRRLGLQIGISRQPVPQVIGHYRFTDFWKRHLRWGRIRKAQSPLTMLVEPLLGSIPSGVIGAFAFQSGMDVHPILFLGAHFSLWFLCDFLSHRAIGVTITLRTPLAWLIRELLHIPLWLHVISGNTVDWRGNQLKIQDGGVLWGVDPESC